MSFDVSKEFRLLLRTTDLSPPIITILSSAFGVAKFASEVYGAIKKKIEEWKERKELYRSLFGFCLNADFITNNVPPNELKKGPWEVTDINAAPEAVGHLLKGFAERPIVKRGKMLLPDFRRNIVSLGGPCRNRFSRWLMKAEDRNGIEGAPPELNLNLEYLPDLPFTFDFSLAENLSWEERLEIKPRPNWPIVRKNKRTTYIPEIYEDSGKRIIKRDYGMIVKVRSFHEEGRREGRWNLMLAGCHGVGTLGAAKALGEENILKEIWKVAKIGEFQAIVAVEVEMNKPKRVELVEVEAL